ncbi:hypothetical protein AALO_G00258460 [Alosa alosa]|uniref:Uncharacterized protein n=1 Tax=Alosa alosa TaxID=278164 RepID=A0AAV6FPM4_9TELE|nr:uncharacterized protein C6orf136 homolog [Alosa sapidissima]XP_048086421.1 uncharacterized protein C6orf136 homolog [Alosa alosa]KAG5264829.1 hypothetical protein AALO_G00258460 [Alosa alosa]
MAVCRGGAAFWVGCLWSHGSSQLRRQPCWTIYQMLEQPLNGSARTLCSASWALAPPNSLRYQNLKHPSLSHPFHHASQPQTAAVLDVDWDETVNLCVLLRPKESEEQHTLVEVSHVGQDKLSELLALGPNRPFELLLPLTTVDGCREDDISITAKDRKEGYVEGTALGKETGSFRSLFETEGCPAPFVLGSHFYCFHCPTMEPLASTGNRLHLTLGLEAQASGLPPLPSVSYFEDEPDRVERSKSDSERENEEKLAVMYERLRLELPQFFVKSHDYCLYSNDIEFINGLINTKTKGRMMYQLTLSLWRLMCLCYYAEARIEVLKLTKHPEDGSVRARWRIRGLPFHMLLLRFYKKDKSHLYRSYDAFSTFYLGSDGLIHCHRVEKVMQAQPPVLPRVTSLLAGALMALGVQEHRPAVNLLPFLLSSFRQGRD